MCLAKRNGNLEGLEKKTLRCGDIGENKRGNNRNGYHRLEANGVRVTRKKRSLSVRPPLPAVYA